MDFIKRVQGQESNLGYSLSRSRILPLDYLGDLLYNKIAQLNHVKFLICNECQSIMHNIFLLTLYTIYGSKYIYS